TRGGTIRKTRRVHGPRESDFLAGGWDRWLHCVCAVWARFSGGRSHIRGRRASCVSAQPGDRGHSFLTCPPFCRVGRRPSATFDSCSLCHAAKRKPAASANVAIRRCRRRTSGCGRGHCLSLGVQALEARQGLRATCGLHGGADVAERLCSGRTSHLLQGSPGDEGCTRNHLQATVYSSRAGLRGLKVVSRDRKSTRLNSSHVAISYARFCLTKKPETFHSACSCLP